MPTRCVAAACSNTHRDGVSLFTLSRDRCEEKLSELIYSFMVQSSNISEWVVAVASMN